MNLAPWINGCIIFTFNKKLNLQFIILCWLMTLHKLYQNPLLLMDSQLVFSYIYVVQLHMVLNLISCSDMLKTLLFASLFSLHCIFVALCHYALVMQSMAIFTLPFSTVLIVSGQVYKLRWISIFVMCCPEPQFYNNQKKEENT